MNPRLLIVEEWFEYCLLPPIETLSFNNLLKIASNLPPQGEIVTRSSFQKVFTDCPKTKLIIMYETLEIYSECVTSENVLIFLFVQLFHHPTFKEMVASGDVYPKSTPCNSLPQSPMNTPPLSPRCQTIHSLHLNGNEVIEKKPNMRLTSSRASIGENDRHSILAFVKNHLAKLLALFLSWKLQRVISLNKIENESIEIGILDLFHPFLKYLNDSKLGNSQEKLSAIFAQMNRKTKEKTILKNILDWMVPLIGLRGHYFATISFLPDGTANNVELDSSFFERDRRILPTGLIKGKTKSVIWVQPHVVQDLTNIRIHKCHFSFIYFFGTARNMTISDCSNCTIFITSVKNIAHIYHSDNIKIIAVCGQMSIAHSTNVQLNLYTLYSPLIWSSTCSQIVLGPFNADYPTIDTDLKRNGFNPNSQSNRVFSPRYVWEENNCTSLLPPEKFNVFRVPFELHSVNDNGRRKFIASQFHVDEWVIPLPIEYRSAWLRKLEKFDQLRGKIQEAKKSSFENKFDTKFTEWLKARNLITEINGLAELGKHIIFQ
ncbi:Tubulin binding cofactor C domain-containing protein [Rozella allomycis CSF55]|uniref:Tubulin binding cofactor C domain-containing protein n=1 Tax=Rozella allomycis (strain CSF55) TaxID=988480 RepID=A0A075B0D8_ROZAC|nr:Tubulin binding cofactor C domain-containing protein [Rozella allomycis CSF55]|eukprot:EPZ35985.1 Tubulin binding cofactor C domain-containing protein [Rozella allomycis CSF55]